jgi:hypothetical protein
MTQPGKARTPLDHRSDVGYRDFPSTDPLMTTRFAMPSFVITAVLAVLTTSPSPAFTGSVIHGFDPPTRSSRPEVVVLTRGEGMPVVLRWRPTADEPQVVQVGTRTVPSALESPGLEHTDGDARLAGFTRPPIEKLFTLQGRVSRVSNEGAGASSSTDPLEIRWRVMDSAARLFGIRPTENADSTPDSDVDTESEGPGQAPPRKSDQPTTDDLVSSDVRESDRARGSDPAALEKALQFERITNEALQKIDGAAITQTLGTAGVLPAGTTVRLAAADRRADFEASGLVRVLALGQPTLPDEPLAIGGRWMTRDTTMIQSFPVTNEATWTVASFDDEASTIGMATRAVLRVEFSRRIATDRQVPDAVRAAIEADGRGEVTITLDAPTRLEGRFVQTPIAQPRPGQSTDVTRMRLIPLANR